MMTAGFDRRRAGEAVHDWLTEDSKDLRLGAVGAPVSESARL